MKVIALAVGGLLVLAAIGGGFYFFTSRSPGEVAPTPIAVSDQEVTVPSTDQNITEISIEAKEYAFTPKTLTIKAGQKYRLTLENKGRMQHDWVLEDINISTSVVSGGGEASVEFSVDTPGTYTYFCSLSGHRSLGMEGTLTVE